MKKCLFGVVFVLSACRLLGQEDKDYNGALARYQEFFNHKASDSIYLMMTERIRGMMTSDKMSQAFSGMYAQFGEIKGFELIEPNGTGPRKYKTTYARGVMTLLVTLTKDHLFDALRFMPYQEPQTAVKAASNFTYNAKNCTIYGTLTVPESKAKVPVVLIIAGSGPTDRDGNSTMGVRANTYKMIADSLKASGIACLRYDKRSIGESKDTADQESDLRFDDYVADAAGCIAVLQSDGRFSKVIVAGHSEGSLIGMVAAARAKASGFVSISGAGERADVLLRHQLAGAPDELAKEANSMLDTLVSGKLVADVPKGLESLFRASVQPYLISWFKFDPQKEIKKLKVPVSIIQGEEDIQVSVSDAEKLKKADPKAKLVLVPGMTHVLKHVAAGATKEQNMSTYNDPSLPVVPEVIREIVRVARL